MRGRKTVTGLVAAASITAPGQVMGLAPTRYGLLVTGTLQGSFAGVDPSGSFLAEYLPRRAQFGG